MNVENLDEDTKDAIRALAPERRAALREWFADSPHYADFIALIDRINAEEQG
jgi:hypothetical protein